MKGQYFIFLFYLLETDTLEKYISNEFLKNKVKPERHEEHKPLITSLSIVAMSNC